MLILVGEQPYVVVVKLALIAYGNQGCHPRCAHPVPQGEAILRGSLGEGGCGERHRNII